MSRFLPHAVGVALALAGSAFAGIQDLTYYSRLNAREVAIKVYTPPSYEQGRQRYPVVYNLHGGGGSPERQWERTGATLKDAIESGKVRPMIYVFVNGLGPTTLFLDYADGSLHAESTIVEELIPFIDQRFRTVPSHEGRAIEGFSMGGFGALKIAFRHPHLFSSVVSYGGAVLSPDTAKIGPVDPNNGVSRFPTQDYYDRNAPWSLIERNADRIREHLRVRMVCGDQDDKWYPGNVRLKERAEGLKIPVSWASVPGVAHNTKGLYERVGIESLQFIEAGFAPTLPRPEGIARDLTYRSELNQRDILIKVYTPPAYETGTTRYPVVYNLHGAGGGSPQRQWSRTRETLKDAVENGKVRPMIYVFVNGLGDSFFVDYHDGSLKIESSIVRELIPFIDGRYRTIASREGRSIEGFSMGGAGSLMLALKHPDLFGTVVSYGAALIGADRIKPGDERFGTREYFEQNSPWGLAEKNADAIRNRLRIRMVCGDQDGLFAANVRFRELLERLKISAEWVPVPGVAHDTRGLYKRVGLQSLLFAQSGFPPQR